mmetsp:Transcript_21610/g.30968  ORF Transcript_21610/g.30968 Transcript_21610/m.30968 type:complete len:223 (-) Transcript_21610:476-1144(-)
MGAVQVPAIAISAARQHEVGIRQVPQIGPQRNGGDVQGVDGSVAVVQHEGPLAVAVRGAGLVQVVPALGLHRLSHHIVHLLILVLEIPIFGPGEVLWGRLLPQKHGLLRLHLVSQRSGVVLVLAVEVAGLCDVLTVPQTHIHHGDVLRSQSLHRCGVVPSGVPGESVLLVAPQTHLYLQIGVKNAPTNKLAVFGPIWTSARTENASHLELQVVGHWRLNCAV